MKHLCKIIYGIIGLGFLIAFIIDTQNLIEFCFGTVAGLISIAVGVGFGSYVDYHLFKEKKK